MDSDVAERVFEAFFTTKEVTGTGLGLWVSHEIIMKHKGLVRVRTRTASESSGGLARPSGTVFMLFFPDDPKLTVEPVHPVALAV
jgi:signal transduction histidine kinase